MPKSADRFLLAEYQYQWAIRHLSRFGDTDILPVPVEYSVVAKDCGPVSADLANRNLLEHYFRVPRRLAVPKGGIGFRIASQLHPEDTIFITALSYHVSQFVENARPPKSEHISCSFRLDLGDNGQFFEEGFGYRNFNKKTEHYISHSDVNIVLSVDIADFYSNLSHHRIANNLEAVGVSLDAVQTIESMLNQLASNHHSRGIPIGSSGAIVISEAAVLDIDEFLLKRGVKFCRYVDDFRFFFSERREALGGV